MKLKKISQKCYYVPTLCWKFPSGKSRMLFVLLSFPIKWNRKICVMLLSSCNVHMQTVFPFLAHWCKLKREWYQTEQLRSNHETTTCGGFIYPIAQLLLKPPMGSFGHLVCTVCTSSFCPGAVSWISAFLTDDYFVCIGLIYAEMGKITVSFFPPGSLVCGTKAVVTVEGTDTLHKLPLSPLLVDSQAGEDGWGSECFWIWQWIYKLLVWTPA